MAKIVIVIPTFNEKDNTQKMVDVLSLEFAKIKNHEMQVLYVDGNSPDGTAELVKLNQKKYKWLHLLVEKEKEGLGPAYVKGFKYAMHVLKADYVMEFDGDFQHRPDQIIDLVTQVDNGFEYIIGSRYIKGGSIPQEWSFSRKFLSVVGNLVARIGLLMPQVHDLTTGFKLAKVQGVLDKVDLDHLYSRSFAYKLHILAAIVNNGAWVKEVPIEFMARKLGESKLIKNEMIESLKVIFLFQIHNPKITRFLKFGTVGFLGFIVNYVFIKVFRTVGLNETLNWLFATELAIINNYVLNNAWTFSEKKIGGFKNTVAKFLQFNLTSTGALVIQSIFGPLGEKIVGIKYDALILAFVIIFMVLPYNYIIYNLVIWKTWKLKGQK